MSKVIKRSISLSPVVSGWADSLAEAKGYGTNFSAFIADLIRRDWEQGNILNSTLLNEKPDSGSRKLNRAQAQIVKIIREEAQKADSLRKAQ